MIESLVRNFQLPKLSTTYQTGPYHTGFLAYHFNWQNHLHSCSSLAVILQKSRENPNKNGLIELCYPSVFGFYCNLLGNCVELSSNEGNKMATKVSPKENI